MEIFNIDINDLSEAEYNPRNLTDKQKEDIKKSIEEFGFVNPLVVNAYPGRENILVGGHQRLKIAKELGHTTVPCMYVHVNEEREKELNIRLNKNTGEWDLETLAKEFDKTALRDWGFDDEETSVIFLNTVKTSMSGSASHDFDQEIVDLKFEEDLLKEMVVIVFYSQERFKKYKQLREKHDGQEADLIYEAVTKYYE